MVKLLSEDLVERIDTHIYEFDCRVPQKGRVAPHTGKSSENQDHTSQARSQGGAIGAIAPPIPKVALAIFGLIKLLMCKPKKCVSANQRNCQKNYSVSTFSRT